LETDVPLLGHVEARRLIAQLNARFLLVHVQPTVTRSQLMELAEAPKDWYVREVGSETVVRAPVTAEVIVDTAPLAIKAPLVSALHRAPIQAVFHLTSLVKMPINTSNYSGRTMREVLDLSLTSNRLCRVYLW
jgi:hypothetical protein